MASAAQEPEKGIRISCEGDLKHSKAKKFFPITISHNDPIFHDHMISGGPIYEGGPIPSSPISPISKLVNLPIQVRKIAPDPAWRENYTGGLYTNAEATFLLCNLDPASDNCGFAPMYWQDQVGSVLVTTVGSYDITPQQIEALSAYAYHTVVGALGEASETDEEAKIKEVVDGITLEAFEAFYAEFGAKKVKEDPAWETVGEPVAMKTSGL